MLNHTISSFTWFEIGVLPLSCTFKCFCFWKITGDMWTTQCNTPLKYSTTQKRNPQKTLKCFVYQVQRHALDGNLKRSQHGNCHLDGLSWNYACNIYLFLVEACLAVKFCSITVWNQYDNFIFLSKMFSFILLPLFLYWENRNDKRHPLISLTNCILRDFHWTSNQRQSLIKNKKHPHLLHGWWGIWYSYRFSS